jgi:sugar phosphate permease
MHRASVDRRYRWAVLAGGTAAAAGSAVTFVTGLPVLAPALRSEFDLSLAKVGLLLAAAWVGSTLTLLPWGLAADRLGERLVLALGLAGSAVSLVAAAFTSSFAILLILLALAGASGSSVNSASGRAVMQWFGEHERGLALGIRQTAIPIGGLIGALAVPQLVDSGGPRAGFLFLGACSAAGALTGALVVRTRDVESGVDAVSLASTLADRRLWRLSVGSGIYLYGQIAVLGFAVVFLHDEHGVPETSAALVLAIAQALAVVLRIAAGRWSDVVGSRVGPLRYLGLAAAAALALTALLAQGPLWLIVVALTVAGGLSMGWNGLSFAAAAELAGARRRGASIGFQQTVLSAIGVAAPVLFAATLSATSWAVAFLLAAAFPLLGWRLLRPLSSY